jgi:hypothetical protein
MKIHHLFGSALLSTLLLTGCNTEDSKDSTTPTATQERDNTKTNEVNGGALESQEISQESSNTDESQNALTRAIQAESLNATSRNIKVALSKFENENKSLNAVGDTISVSDIVFAFFNDDINDAQGNELVAGAARAYFAELVANGEVILTDDEAAEFSIMSDEAFNEAFTEGFAEAVSGHSTKSTQGFLSDLKDKIKGTEKKVVTKTKDKIEDVVEIVKDAGELAGDIAKNTVEGTVEVIKDAGGAIDDLAHGDLSGVKDRVDGIKDDIGDSIKDSVVDIAESDLVAPVVDEVFKVMLNSGKVTKVMLDMAIKSETITRVMIDALEHDWGLTTKMVPLLESDPEFGYKFAQLAQQWDIMSHYFFEAVDAPMYDALTKAMILNPGTALIMSELMDQLAVEYFVIPAIDYVPSAPGVAGDKERFVSLLFSTGRVSDVANDSTSRGDGNELANEAFFYALFKSPESTTNFVAAMQKVKDNDPATVKALMDNIFLGKQNTANGLVTDSEQSIYNIYSIAKAMAEGIGGEGLDTYKNSFVGFAGLVSFDSYLPYAKSFVGAGSHYMNENGYSVSEFISLAKDSIFPSDEVDAPSEGKTVQSKRLHAEGDEEVIENAWYDDVWNSVVEFFDFESISAWWDDQTVQFDTYIDEIKITIGETVDSLTEEARIYLEGEIQTLIGDPDYLLPPFSELSIDYVTGEATRRFDDYVTVNGYDDILSDISETEFVQEYVYGTILGGAQDSEYWEYMPNWIAGMDWLKLPSTYEDYKLEFNADNIAVYIISKNDSLESMRNILGKPDLIAVDSLEDSPISNESGEFYIYKLIVLNGEDIDFGALAEAGEEAGDYVSNIVVDNSEATSEPETTS